MSKSDQIFGRNADTIHKWAAGAARDFGQSTQQAEESASSFGNMFRQLDIGVQPATRMSKKMVELASDFASFHNADITDVLQAQQAAFRGEYDAVQRFVPTINAAAVQQKAMAMTGKENAASLTDQEKALATYQLLLQGAGKAQGDFDRTSGGAANQMRIMQAELTNAAAQLGTVLLPIVTKAAGIISGFAQAFASLPPGAKEVITVIGGVVAAVGPFLVVGSKMIQWGKSIHSAWKLASDALIDVQRAAVNTSITMAQTSVSGATWGQKLGTAATGVGLGLLAYEGTLTLMGKAQEWVFGKTVSLEDRLKQLGATVKAMDGPTTGMVARFTDVVRAYALSHENAAGLTVQLGAFKEVAASNIGVAARLADQFGTTSVVGKLFHDTLDRMRGAQNDANNAQQAGQLVLQGYSAAAADAAVATQSMHNSLLAAAGGTVGYQAALMNIDQAQRTYNQAVAEHGADSAEAAEAANRLQSAQLQGVQAANSLDQANQALTQALASGTKSYDEQKKQLDLALFLHPENAAGIQLEKEALDRAKAAADALPGSKTVKVNADTGDFHAALDDVNRTVQETSGKVVNVVINTIHKELFG
jgi:hypothetical protein